MSLPSAKESKLGVSESMFHAQVIIDAFSKALQEKQCMSRIPIAVYTEAELYEERLKYTLTYFNIDEEDDPILEPELSYSYVVPGEDPDLSTVQEPEERDAVIGRNEYRREWVEECFNCDYGELPELDLDAIFADILRRINDFIDQIRHMFDFNMPNFCQFAYLLSWICIPDLVAILALLLAAILKLIGSIFLGVFSLAAFIMGIIQMIIGALLRFALAMIAYALAPIACLLDTLANIANALPTDEVLERRLTTEEYSLLTAGEARPDGSRDIPSEIARQRANVEIDRVSKIAKVRDTLGSVSKVIQKASDSIDDSIEDMFGLIKFLECEPQRSGVSIFERINEVLELIQIVNIIMALIDKKASSSVLDGLCREEDSYEQEPLFQGNNPEESEVIIPEGEFNPFKAPTELTPEEIVEVIQDALGHSATVVTDDNGLDIGMLIGREQEYEPRLNLYSCDIPDIIREYHIDAVIDRATSISEDHLFGIGPGLPSTTNIDRVTVRDTNDALDTGDYQYIPFDVPAADSTLNQVIRDLISERRRNGIPSTRSRDGTITGTESSEITPDSNIEESNTGFKEPDTEVSINDYSLGIMVENSIPSSTFNKTVELKCGSIADIQEQFSTLKDNT